MKRLLILATFIVVLGGCSSVGSLGIVTRSRANSAELLRSGHHYKELGYTEGSSCRSFLLAIIPWGNADIQAAIDDALNKKGADALINVTTENSLYGFIPIYNVFTSSCTRVKGIAVKFE